MQHVRRACTVVLKAFARNMSRVCSLAYICWYIWQQLWLIYLWVLCWLRGGTCEPPLRPPSSRTRPSCLINKHKDFRAGAMSITSLVFNSWLYGSCSTRQQQQSTCCYRCWPKGSGYTRRRCGIISLMMNQTESKCWLHAWKKWC